MKARYLLAAVAMMVSIGAFAESKKEWNGKMAALMSALAELAPSLFTDDTKANAKADAQFAEQLKRVVEISRDIDQNKSHPVTAAPDDDPGLVVLSQLFREDLERAVATLEPGGRTDYAKSVVRTSVSYCVACHTRGNGGPQFPLIKAFESGLKSASWLEKLSFKAATRQYDEALADVMRQLDSGESVGSGVFELERGVRIALMIAIRVKANPERAILLAEAVLKSKTAPDSLKFNARTWLKDTRAWQAEPKRNLKTDVDLLRAARSLLSAPEDLDGVRTGGSEVRHLRASQLMHDLLRLYPKSDAIAEALYLIGSSYDVLGDLGFWSLGETYFQACIRRAPHTEMSERCFDRYENSIILGYTGSRGTVIPSAVRTHLNGLKELSKRQKEQRK